MKRTILSCYNLRRRIHKYQQFQGLFSDIFFFIFFLHVNICIFIYVFLNFLILFLIISYVNTLTQTQMFFRSYRRVLFQSVSVSVFACIYTIMCSQLPISQRRPVLIREFTFPFDLCIAYLNRSRDNYDHEYWSLSTST